MPRRSFAMPFVVLVLFVASCKPSGNAEPAPSAPPPPEPKPAVAANPAPVAPPVANLPAARHVLGSAPPAGVPTEYDQMVEPLRAKMVQLHEPMDMVALSIDRIGDWAWLSAQPREPGRPADMAVDPVQGLMHKVGQAWTLVSIACSEPENDNCTSNPDFPKVFAARFTGTPIALFDENKNYREKPRATFDGQFGDTLLRYPLADLASRVPLAAGETFKIAELGRDEHSSHHVVALLDREPLHRHDTHDLLVVVLEGEGEMLIGDKTRTIGAHSIVYVPRHTVHSMHNTTKKPLIGYAVFTPPFDGKDRVPVTNE
jgi:mannose-6-phosphate isomerase-like protein (cupin superfamily)